MANEQPRLESAARDMGQEIIDSYSLDLLEESRRIARRAESSSISTAYMQQAALNLKLRKAGGASTDLLLTIGVAMLAGAIGVLVTIRTASVETETWVEVVTIAAIVVGAAMSAIGATLRILERRR